MSRSGNVAGERTHRFLPGALVGVAAAMAMVASLVTVTAVSAVAGTQPQTVQFTPPYDGVVGESLTLHATAASGLPAAYSLATTSACTISGASLTFVATGSCDVTASQAGNGTWAPAAGVTQTIYSNPGYEATTSIETTDDSPRTPGTIKVGDQLTVALAASDSTAVTSCLIRITSAGGWLMESPGSVVAGRCTLMFTIPAYTDPAARSRANRVDGDLCISIMTLAFADAQSRSMVTANRGTPGGVDCYNGGDRSGREDSVLDLQVLDGGSPQPFVSNPEMVSWNPADWVGYQPLQFGQTAHLQLPSFATSCHIYLNGSWQTIISPPTTGTCTAWDVRLPGVLPSTLPWGGGPGDWQVEVVANYSTPAGAGTAIGSVNMPYASSDGIFESNQPAMFPTDLAAARFATVGEEWTPSFKVSGVTPADCRMEVITVPPTFPIDQTTFADYDASAIDADGTCHFDVPAYTKEWEFHQYIVEANRYTNSDRVTFGGSITAIAAPSSPVISDPTTSAGSTSIDVAAGAGQGLMLDLSVAPSPGPALAGPQDGATPAVTGCTGSSVTGDLANGGAVPDITASCKLPTGTYTALAHMYDAAGKVTTTTRQFTVPAIVPGATYYAISPGRVLDSRSGFGAGLFHSRTKQSFQVTGLWGVPAGAVAVTGNVTVVGQTAAGYVTVAPSLTSGSQPLTSTINFPAGDIRANGVTVALGAAGKLDAMYWTGNAANTTQVLFDVTGYFANDTTGATFHAIAPGRVLDSRSSVGAGLFHSRTKQSFAVTGLWGVPAGAVAVTGNVTITGQKRTGYVTIAPSLTSASQPQTSTINFPLGDTRANGVTVSLGAGGRLDAMYWSSSTSDTVNIIFDVTGYFANDATGATFHAITPGRVLDSRAGSGASLFHSRSKQSFAITGLWGVPAGAVAVTGNVTVVGQTAASYVTVAPSLTSGSQPLTSTINFPAGDIRANGVTVSLGAGGKLDAMYWTGNAANTTQLLFDVTGYFS